MRNLGWRAVVSLVVIVAAAILVFSQPARLGLDLRGGTQIVLEAQDTGSITVDDDVMSRTVEVMRRRVDAIGVTEPTLQRTGDRRIIVELPGVSDPEEAAETIGRTAPLAVRPVIAAGPDVTDPGEGSENILVQDEDGIPLLVGPPAVTGEAVGNAQALFQQGAGTPWVVDVEFQGAGADDWTQLTADAACSAPGDPQRRIAIVLDTEVISSPQVDPSVGCGQGIPGGSTIITGNFDQAGAEDLALLIRAGALPVPVNTVEQRTIGPTLGEAAIAASLQAAILGAGLTLIYMIASYRLFGVVAAIALMIYGLVSYAALLAIGATLTLPGIAGFVLAIGMAVDANVLVFERAKEEFADGLPVRAAARAGFERAFSAIADSNVTTVIAAILLFFYSTGAVRGFGITVTIGVMVSMFTALVVTRVLIEILLMSKKVVANPNLLGFGVGGRLRDWLATNGPDIMSKARLWLTISAVAMAIAIAAVAIRGLSYGLEFSGGRLLEYSTERPVDLDELRAELAAQGLARSIVQESGEGNISIRTPELTEEEVALVVEAVERVGGESERQRDEFVGPTIGDELRRRALLALGIALAAQLAYLAFRFRWTYATAAVSTMLHDVVILVGLFALLGKELDGVFLAALLTVIGYSVNDSVVVFDRIREKWQNAGYLDTLRKVANDACLQTLPRTINTGLGALFILFALYLLGGDTLSDFALALLVGILVGTYSSIFVAAPVALQLEKWAGTDQQRPTAPPPKKKASASTRPIGSTRGSASRGNAPRPSSRKKKR